MNRVKSMNIQKQCILSINFVVYIHIFSKIYVLYIGRQKKRKNNSNVIQRDEIMIWLSVQWESLCIIYYVESGVFDILLVRYKRICVCCSGLLLPLFAILWVSWNNVLFLIFIVNIKENTKCLLPLTCITCVW